MGTYAVPRRARRQGLLGKCRENGPWSVAAHSPVGGCRAAWWRSTRAYRRPGGSAAALRGEEHEHGLIYVQRHGDVPANGIHNASNTVFVRIGVCTAYCHHWQLEFPGFSGDLCLAA